MTKKRPLVSLWLAATCVVSMLAGPAFAAPQPANPAPAAPAPAAATGLEGFDPGMIISDAAFYNADSMSPQQVADFINARGSGCSPSPDGTPCLRDFRTATPSVPATAYCAPVAGVASNTAAGIISSVSEACGINPQVLLVLIQKEQGLLTASGTALSATKYARATGSGCPDFQGCDPSRAGFFTQVYGAGEHFQKYRAHPNSFRHQAGQTETIAYNPEPACGAASVFIQNQATAGLYNYTPFVPNQAALDAVSATGDACSAYGNRNFYRYFKAWFPASVSASTAAPLAPQAGSGAPPALMAINGTAARLGSDATGGAAGAMVCGLAGGGCLKQYRNNLTLYYSASGTWAVKGAIRAAYAAAGSEGGTLGFPLMDEACSEAGNCFQSFVGGDIYWQPGRQAAVVLGDIREKWISHGYEHGPLGQPAKSEVCGLPEGGCSQAFTGGSIYWHPTHGAHVVPRGFTDRFTAWGYPVADATCDDKGCHQDFQRAALYYSPDTGAHAVGGEIREFWASQGGSSGTLGYPTSDEIPEAGGVRQTFQGGTVHSRPGRPPYVS
ncbi:MAG: LGFP repeat-containing protein [Actinomycetes bacterium]